MQLNRKFITMMLTCSFLNAVDLSAQIVYPVTNKQEIVDDYFGVKVADPYRWLENDNSDTTKAWVIEQNAVTNKYLDQIPYKNKIKNKLEDMWNYPKYGTPFKRGNYYYFYKNDGLQNQSVLYRQIGLTGTSEIFLDANSMSKDGTVAPGVPVFTKTAKYCAYELSVSGSDWQEIYIMDVATKKILHDKVEWVKFSEISWKGEEGFYYSRYPKPDENNKLSQQNQYHAVYFHKVGTTQKEDVLLYEDKAHPFRTISCRITEDERFLTLTISEGTSGSEILVKDLTKKDVAFALLIKGFETEPSVIENDSNRILVITNADAPNYKIVSIDPENPAKENWIDIIPARTKLLQSAGTAGGKLFLTYMENAVNRVYQCNYKGNLEREIKLAGLGSVGGFDGYKDDKEIFYVYTSFASPTTIYRYEIKTGKAEIFRRSELKFNIDDFVTEQHFFTSADGASVPMFLTYKKGLKLTGKNPTLLYGYGGFNIPITPFFSISNSFFIQQGGIYIVINLRGGNEYGEQWHKAGMLGNKQNVFNDVYAAVKYLTDKKYTSPEHIALQGGSNGGLLVGACITQHPELFKVAIPQVGVLDMLRYHLFTIGWAWATEYGRSDKKEEFEYLYKYSPLHNLKKGTTYPATLITTADHDDRVVPAHSFKFAAQLQEYNDGKNPTLIRIETKAGHGAGKPTSKVIEEVAEIWSFVMYNLGMEFKE